MLRLFPLAALLILVAPVAAGTAGILLPAFGYLPVLGQRELSLDPLRDLAAMPGLLRSALLSIGTGLGATAIAFTAVVLFVAGWRGTRLFRALERLVSPLLAIPHAAVAFGLAFLIAPSGLIVRLASPWLTGLDRPPDLLIINDRLGLAMTFGLVVKEIPFLFLIALAALPQVQAEATERMTRALGYGRVRGFLLGAFPKLYGQLRLPVLAVIAYATSVVDVALILGPTTPAPLAVRVLAWRNDPDLDRQLVAAAGAVLQIGVTAAALAIWLAAERIGARLGRALATSGRRGQSDIWLRGLAAGAIGIATAAIVLGMLVLALWSVAGAWQFPQDFPSSLTLATWARLLPSLAGPLANTLVLAALSSLISVVLTLGALEFHARKGRTDAGPALKALYIPLIAPQVAFLFGLQVLLSFAGLDGTLAAVALVHIVFVFPYVLLSLSDPWWHWDPRYGQAARALGRGADAVFWRVRLPMLARPVLTAAALGFAVSVALYLPTLLVGGGRWPTVTTETVALASGGDRKLIGATALLQAALPFLGFALAALIPAVLFRRQRGLRADG